jgi:hypothetical protein
MQEQNYKNHPRLVPLYHVVLSLILIACFIFSVWNLYRAYDHHSGRLVAVTLCGFCIAFVITAWYARVFALAAQDRAIRAEENLRHFVLTGKLLDKRLTIWQIIALRLAEDTEFLLLAERAVKENMKPKEIKIAIANWKEDHHRV